MPITANEYQLEDYIFAMECQQQENNEQADVPKDIYTCLAEKESNLVLAAELGKALLDRNEKLVQDNERLALEYSQKLEELEQDKHKLRRKLTTTENEYDVKIQELNTDLQIVKHELQTYKENSKQTDKERSQLLEQLREQNQRLTNELKESCRNEEMMSEQLHQMKEKINLRQSNMTDHLTTLDTLRDEIYILTSKKTDLEKRLNNLVEERQDLSLTLDESSDRIQVLERQKEEQEEEIRHKERDLEDLRHTNLNLSDRLEAISRASSSPSMGHTSLMNEMELSENENSRPHSHQDLLEMDEDVECEGEIMIPSNDSEDIKKLKSEVVDSVGQLKVMSDQLRTKRRNSLTSLSTNSSDDFSAVTLKPGLLSTTVKELKGLVRIHLLREAQGQCGSCGANEDESRRSLEQECHKALETVDKITSELQETKDKLKAKIEENEKLTGQVTLAETKQKASEEERDVLKTDLENTHLAKDEIVKKAWDSRDQAIARKNNCEIELAKTRIDLMQVNSQLLEAITQKVELSQQLDQWQQDMQQLLDDQMRRKLTKHELLHGDGSQNSDSDSSNADKNSPRKSNRRIFNLINMLTRK